ncbi:helix-turn-helix domain-containing protein [Streptomyces sp. NPDC058548]|uniref:helix-turn-helix domain-containing protein n=1 Tax=Streptomyces sp. NPDC058548 TaxID=3346545 RepID=UPI0036486404
MGTHDTSARTSTKSRKGAENHPRTRTRVGGVIHRNVRHTTRFTVVGNHLSQHEALSLVAIGLATHIQSLPTGAPVDIKTLAGRFPEGTTTIASGLRELELHGYLIRTRERTEGGQMVTRTVSCNHPGRTGGDEAGTEPEPELELELRPEPELEPELELGAELELEPELGLGPELELELGPEAKPEPELELELEAEPETEAKPAPKPAPAPEPAPAPAPQPAPAPEAKPEPSPEPSPEAKPAPAPPAARRAEPRRRALPAVPQPAYPAPDLLVTALDILCGLRRVDPRLHLSATDAEHLAPGVAAWLERELTPDAVRRVLTFDLPREPLRRPAALLAHRLGAQLPPLPPFRAPSEAPPVRHPLQNCDTCDRAYRAPEPGTCGACRR